MSFSLARRCAAWIVPLVLASSALITVAQSPAEAAPKRTTVTLLIPSCVGCSVALSNTRNVGSGFWRGPKTVSAKGRVSFTIPRFRTRGLMVKVSRPGDDWDAELFTVMRYRGKKAGQKIGVKAAGKRAYGCPCWAGTKKRKVTITINTKRIWMQHPYFGMLRGTRSWANPSVKSFGGRYSLWKGAYGSQGLTDCRGD